MSEPTPAEIARFNSNWIKQGDCHIWIGTKDRDGFGIIGFRRANRRSARVAMFLAGKKIPTGFIVTQTCGNHACVNPQHLNAVARNDDWKKRSRSSVNRQKTHCPKGHPYDRKYGRQRYCSICESDKSKRLRAKWKAEGIFKI